MDPSHIRPRVKIKTVYVHVYVNGLRTLPSAALSMLTWIALQAVSKVDAASVCTLLKRAVETVGPDCSD
jgi:hypothetical protein